MSGCSTLDVGDHEPGLQAPSSKLRLVERRVSTETECLVPVIRSRGRESALTHRHRVRRRLTSAATRFMGSRHIQPPDALWVHDLRSAGFPAGMTPTGMPALGLPGKPVWRDSEEDSRAGLATAGAAAGPNDGTTADEPAGRFTDVPASGALGEVALPFMRSGNPEWVGGFLERSDADSPTCRPPTRRFMERPDLQSLDARWGHEPERTSNAERRTSNVERPFRSTLDVGSSTFDVSFIISNLRERFMERVQHSPGREQLPTVAAA